MYNVDNSEYYKTGPGFMDIYFRTFCIFSVCMTGEPLVLFFY